MLVELENVTTGYGRTVVFENVSLTFAGGVAGLVGPNGAGKTTLLRTLLGFLPVQSGRVRVCGLPLPDAAMAVRAKIGYMPEGDAIIGNMTAVEYVSYLGELSGLPRQAAIERAHAMLQYVGLGEARYRTLDTYSTGMKQRVKLAQAIVHDPELLLLDEPTDGMDPSGRNEMLDLLYDLGHSKNTHLIICSHLLDDVERVADELILINQGKIVSRKLAQRLPAAQSLFAARVHGDVAMFLAALANYGGQLISDPEGANVKFSLPAECSTSVVFEAAKRSGCVVLRLEPLVERAADVVFHLLKEADHAHL